MNKSIQVKAYEYLSANKIFSHCSQEEKEILVSVAVVRSFQKGKVIFCAKNKERCIGLIAQGSASVSKGAKNQVTISRLHEGELFGAVTLFASRNTFVNTITATSDCTVVFFSYESIMDLMQSNPEVWQSYITYLSDRIYFLNDRIDEFTASNTLAKLAMYLDECSKGKDEFKLPISMISLSKLLDIGRSSLYRSIEELEEVGAIKREAKQVKILNRSILESYKK